MNIKYKFTKLLKKVFVYLSVFSILFNNSIYLVIAQEATPTETSEPAAVVETPVVTETPAITENPTDTETPTDTPSATPTETVVTEPVIEEVVTITPTPNLIIDTDTTSESNSGNNIIESTPSATIDIATGDTTAGNNSDNTINANNQATENNNQADSSANSGNNTVNVNENNQTQVAVISTGEAKAFVNLINLINTTLIDSDVKISIINLTPADSDVNLNEVYNDVVAGGEIESVEPANIKVINGNVSQINNSVEVSANSGGNQANVTGGLVIIQTGNAKALANIINLVNTKLVASNYFISIVNIDQGFKGNIILPRPERFETITTGTNTAANNQGISVVESVLSGNANSGTNQTVTGESSLMTTGNAVSIMNNITVINGDISGNQFNLIINNLGEWEGMVLGWENSTTSQQMMGYYAMLQNAGTTESADSSTVLVDYGFAWVKDNVTVAANSGGNSINGADKGVITTGDSLAMGNLFNLINLNFFNSNNFLGFINIMGKWEGNLVFAYPDLEINFESVDESRDIYRINYKNIGYDTASDVMIEINLPEGLRLEGKKNYVWKAGDVPMGGSGYINIKTERINENNWARLLVKEVYAEEKEVKDVSINARIFSADPELSFGNNQAEKWVKIYREIPDNNNSSGNNDEAKMPVTRVWSDNNVNDFVYAGDSVIFKVGFENVNDVVTVDNYMSHTIYDIFDKPIITTNIDLGKIEAGEKSLLTFEINLPAEVFTYPGKFAAKSVIKGKTTNGSEYTSDTGVSDFELRVKHSQIAGRTGYKGIAKPVEAKILGSYTTEVNIPDWYELWPYIILMTSSMLWIELSTRQKGWLTSGRKLLLIGLLAAWCFATATIFTRHQGLSNLTTTKIIGVNLK